MCSMAVKKINVPIIISKIKSKDMFGFNYLIQVILFLFYLLTYCLRNSKIQVKFLIHLFNKIS